MVTLHHQEFCQPITNLPQRESREANGYSLENNVPEEEDRVMNFASETGRLSRPVSPDANPNDAPAAVHYPNYPNYPKEVAHYPSSRYGFCDWPRWTWNTKITRPKPSYYFI
ncbi:uncharacterized protein N7503_009870 [Penicillium pulvis]|uniref:uncharacterized protein n=1 Tax=Penicillium pulvis TaxID=1562058 RepID=UPI002547797C|nr:uncharacterized protein N7503_009870 [Penicillium pulvis]KAJ5784658.1 hypothetical protein N7503_009870 [Penicillium pulvis]